MTDELTTRLQSSTSEVSLTDEVKTAHLRAISEALEGAPIVPLNSVSRRRRVIAALTAAALIGPTGLAAASGDALPGERLYGVKQVSEQVTSLFDPEVIARHRIEEAEALAMLGRRSDDAISKAADAVADLPEDHALRQRLAALADDRDDDDTEQEPVVQPDLEDDTSDDGTGDDSDDGVADDDTSDDDADDDSADDPEDATTSTVDDGIDDDVTDDAGQPDDSDDGGDSDFDDDSTDGDESDSEDDTEDD